MTSPAIVELVSKLVSEITGIQLGVKQRSMVESRLARRMIQLGMATDSEYEAHLKNNRESEMTALVSLLTTHHTNFFREFTHFEFLQEKGLHLIVQSLKQRKQNTIRVWSAACSRGHEVYTLAMFLQHHLPKIAPEMKFEIYGSDVDSKSVEIAKNAVYRWDDVKGIPAIYLADHWARGTGEIADFVKAKPAIKNPCSFGVVNLIDFDKSMSGKMFDIIFCRNVFIYFNLQQIQEITKNLLKHLNPDGLLLIGISESLNGTQLPISYLAPSIYSHRKAVDVPDAKPVKIHPAVRAPHLPLGPTPTANRLEKLQDIQSAPVRVFCIDDSPTILTLLKKILSKENGFELVGTAENGAVAAEKLKGVLADVVTLDIHMPVMNGIEYLQKNMNPSHPPIVMVSSVSREDTQLGLKSLEYGASDYVEKPSLQNISQVADEIRSKLRCTAFTRKKSLGTLPAVSHDLEQSFAKKLEISMSDKKVRLLFGSLGDREKIARVLKDFQGAQPPIIICMSGAENLVSQFSEPLSKSVGKSVELLKDSSSNLRVGQIYFADIQTIESHSQIQRALQISLMVLGVVSKDLVQKLIHWPKSHLIAEDLGVVLSQEHRTLLDQADLVVTYPSFQYHSDEYLSHDIGVRSGGAA